MAAQPLPTSKNCSVTSCKGDSERAGFSALPELEGKIRSGVAVFSPAECAVRG